MTFRHLSDYRLRPVVVQDWDRIPIDGRKDDRRSGQAVANILDAAGAMDDEEDQENLFFDSDDYDRIVLKYIAAREKNMRDLDGIDLIVADKALEVRVLAAIEKKKKDKERMNENRITKRIKKRAGAR